MIHLFLKILSFSTFILIFAGGLVTSTDSGLSVPDWPMSYGTWFPPMVGGIRFEHSHRVIAGFVLILTFIATVAVFKCSKVRALKSLALIAIAAVFLQAALGGMTVIMMLPKPISILHACLGQTFFALTVIMAWMTCKHWKAPLQVGATSLATHYSSSLMLILVMLQLAMGASLRHGFRFMLIPHICMALLILLASVGLCVVIFNQCKGIKPMQTLGVLLMLAVMLQWALGLGAMILTQRHPEGYPMALDQSIWVTIHQSMGAIVFAIACMIVSYAFQWLKSKPQA